mmetsp:Transcript_26984/g.23823  ORF Transcript_26984/g.23823 Transcript_26984/m.23823 type:complete len:125 (+) Transcript_26984:94-468(+)
MMKNYIKNNTGILGTSPISNSENPFNNSKLQREVSYLSTKFKKPKHRISTSDSFFLSSGKANRSISDPEQYSPVVMNKKKKNLEVVEIVKKPQGVNGSYLIKEFIDSKMVNISNSSVFRRDRKG